MTLRFSLIRNVAIGAGLVVAVGLLAPFAVVPAGYRGVMTTFGKVDQQVYGEGLHVRWPIAQAMHLIDVRIQKGEGEGEAASKDLQVVWWTSSRSSASASPSPSTRPSRRRPPPSSAWRARRPRRKRLQCRSAR